MSAHAAAEVQRRTDGDSTREIHEAAVAKADPKPGLRSIAIGTGTAELLRKIRDQWSPSGLVALDLVPWLPSDLRADVELHVGEAVTPAADVAPADSVLVVETLEHVDARWVLLRTAARLAKPGGVLVITTPTLRHRLELLARGEPTSFRGGDLQHLTPVLPHVSESILRQKGMLDVHQAYAGRDIVSGGRLGPCAATRRAPALLNISLFAIARRANGATAPTAESTVR